MRVLLVYAWDGGFVQQQYAELSNHTSVERKRLRCVNGPRLWVETCAVLQALWHALTQGHRHTVILSYGSWPCGVFGAVVKLCLDTPHVIYEHLSPAESLLRYQAALFALSTAERILSPSADHALMLEHITGRSVQEVPNLVTQYPRMVFDPKLVVAVGRMVEQKGFDYLVQAARYMPELRFIIVGTGPLWWKLRRMAPSNVQFIRRMPHSDILSLLARAACVVCPSVHESFGMVAAEAAFAGTPVVATPVGVHRFLAAVTYHRQSGPRGLARCIDTAMAVERNVSFMSDSAPHNWVRLMLAALDVPKAGDCAA